MTRYLVLGDPVVSLGTYTLIPDGGLVVEDAIIIAVGPKGRHGGPGPFRPSPRLRRPLRAAGLRELPLPLRTCHRPGRVYRPSAEVRRWAELGTLVEPYLPEFYRPWYETPIEPAYVYNARRPPNTPGVS